MLFNGCKNIEKINFPKWYTPYLEDISYLFNRCLNLKEITNLSKLNTSKVTDMSGLFSRCEKLSPNPRDWRVVQSFFAIYGLSISKLFLFRKNL